MLTTNYRQPINFTREIVDQAKASLQRLTNAYFRLEEIVDQAKSRVLTNDEELLLKDLDEFKDEFIRVMDDDLNTADAITVLFDMAKFINTRLGADSPKELVVKTYKLYDSLFQSLGLLAKKKQAEVDIEKSKPL